MKKLLLAVTLVAIFSCSFQQGYIYPVYPEGKASLDGKLYQPVKGIVTIKYQIENIGTIPIHKYTLELRIGLDWNHPVTQTVVERELINPSVKTEWKSTNIATPYTTNGIIAIMSENYD